MAISLKHTFQSAKADGADTTLVQPSNWNAEHTLTAAAGKVLGRDTSGAGAVQELPIAVDTSGNVGIGTSTPKGKLQVNGGDIVTDAARGLLTNLYYEGGWKYVGNGYGAVIAPDTGGTGVLTIQQAPNNTGGAGAAATPVERMRIDSAGNVGIGTSSPGGKLHTQLATSFAWGGGWSSGVAVFGGGSIVSGALAVSYNDTDGAIIGAIAPGVAWKPVKFYSDSLIFATNGSSERMRIDSAGNVGIGAASSGSLLEIRKDQNADTVAKIINSNTGVNATARLDLATGTANAYCIFALKDNGGSPYILMSSGSAITAMYHDMASHIFRSQAGTEWLRIEATAGTLLSAPTYNNTATGSTVVVTSTGQIRRTSSSIKYKKDVESLDPALATNAIDNLRPVWYRTKNAEGDDKVTWSHIGLIAEEVDLVEPRLVRYRTAEIVEEQKPVLDEAGAPVLDDEGNPKFTTEQVARELAIPEPEDVDYARLSVLLLAELQSLRARVAALEAAT